MQMYNIEQYTDEECFKILSLQDSPDDETLEKRIIEYRKKYQDRKTEKTTALYDFFSAMYDRFFEDVKEGFEEMQQIVNGRIDENEDGIIDTNDVVQSSNMESIYEYDDEKKITVTRDTQYFRGQLNPLLKETIKRTININSSDRDKVFDQMNALTTDFNFSLEETLKNVVSLKLYAIQVPFTWYTIDDAVGSNIIYFKSNTPGIQGKHHEYNFHIAPGNYDPISLTDAVRDSLQVLQSEHKTVDFGNTTLTYNPNQMIATFQFDIQKIYDTKEFTIEFENNPTDNSYNNLATFLCFSNKSKIGLETDISKNYLKTPRIDVSSNTLTSIDIVRYSACFDSFGKMMDISSHLVYQKDIKNESFLRNEEVIVTIAISPDFGTDEILSWINRRLAETPNLSQSRVFLDNFMLHWDINFDSFETKPPLINQKMALKISGNDTTFFPNKYVDLDGLPYRYVIESNSPIVPANKYDTSDMRVVLFNNTARYPLSSDIEFNANVDMSFSLPDLSNLLIRQLITNVIGQFQTITEFSIVGEEEAENTNSVVDTIFKIDVSKNITYPGTDFLNSPTSNTKPGIDFSGGLYKVFLFRNAGETDVSYITISSEQVPRTSFETNNDAEFIYTSYRPNIDDDYKESGLAIIFTGNADFPDFSLNVDISLSFASFSLVNVNPGRNGIFYDLLLENEEIEIENVIPLSNTNHRDGNIRKSTLTIRIRREYTTKDYSIFFISNSNIWTNALKLDSSYNLSLSSTIRGTTIDTSNKFRGISKKITISTNATSEIYGYPDIVLTLPINPNGYDLAELISALNDLLSSNKNLYGSYFELTQNNTVKGFMNITTIFTTQDYNLVLYDETSFEACNSSVNYARAAKNNTTLGYILGFRKDTIYPLALGAYAYDTFSDLLTNAFITLHGDSVVSVSLYNKLFIVLEDYNQNHVNDGLVSVSQRDTRATLPVYALRNIYNCNPETNERMNQGLYGKHLTNRQIYSMNQIIESQNETTDSNKGTRSLKDVFAIVPIKYGLNPGDIFVEFGGTLQAQERTYFGPVNISRLRVKLLTDRGDVINLNNADWSFQIICEQLWQNIK